MAVATDGAEPTSESFVALAKALQDGHPRSLVVRQFGEWVAATTYQEPKVISRDVAIFNVRNLWGCAAYYWAKKYGEKKAAEEIFRDWAKRRHGIAHRSGRSRAAGRGLTQARHGKAPTRDEALGCLQFFRTLIALVDYQLNESIYGKQPRRRKSDVAVFDLTPVSRTRSKRRTSRRLPAPITVLRGPSIAAD